MPSETSSPTTSSSDAPAHGAALQAVLPALDRIPDDEVIVPRADIPAATTLVIGAAPEIEVHRAEIEARWGESGKKVVDDLVPLARAASQAHAEHVATSGRDLEPMAAELVYERTLLATDGDALMKRKVLGKKALAGLIGGQAYQDRASDVKLLVAVFRTNWEKIASHTKVSLADLDRAEACEERFTTALGERDQASKSESATGRLRARAFTAFFLNYEEARRKLSFLRWHHDDVDRIAPSIFGGRARSGTDESVIPPPPNPIAPGLPGADPFERTR